VTERDFLVLGDPSGELVSRRVPTRDELARSGYAATEGAGTEAGAKAVAGAAEGAPRAGDGNFRGENGTAAVPADAADPAKVATSGKSPSDVGAAPFGVEPEIFINFARIDAPEDVQAVLGELATAARDAPSEASLLAFRKMLAVHQAVQQEVIAARTCLTSGQRARTVRCRR